MTEIRLRLRQIILITIVFCLILILISSNKCSDNDKLSNSLTNYFKEYSKKDDLPTIYCITPTYYRPVQKAELTRLSHVFMLVPNLHWIIVEDANQTSNLVRNLLKRSNLQDRSTLLIAETPHEQKLSKTDPNWKKARGVKQRNIALKFIRDNVNKDVHSLVFFMDDDNTYSIELFLEMILINSGEVGVWPVGLVGGLMVEKPILDMKSHKVIGFNAIWRPERPFPIDMASFAISTDLLFKRPEAQFSYEVERGYQESELLRHLVTIDQLKPLANFCTEVYVWHTRTLPPKITEDKSKKPSDFNMEV